MGTPSVRQRGEPLKRMDDPLIVKEQGVMHGSPAVAVSKLGVVVVLHVESHSLGINDVSLPPAITVDYEDKNPHHD